MRKIIFCLMAIAIAATSCGKFEEVDFGYPESVMLSSEGGEKIITSDEPFRFAVIQNYKTGDERYTLHKCMKVSSFTKTKW